MTLHARTSDERELYRPTRAEARVACETLLRADLPKEARAVVREILEETENPNGVEDHTSI